MCFDFSLEIPCTKQFEFVSWAPLFPETDLWKQEASWRHLRFVMLGKMDQDFSGRESTVSAQMMCLKTPRTWSPEGWHLLKWWALLSHGVQMMPLSAASASGRGLQLWALIPGCGWVLGFSEALTVPAPCVTPGAVPRASWVLGDSLDGLDQSPGWISPPTVYIY